MTDTPGRIPVGWGEDVLSDFQAIAMGNELASFVHDSEWHGLLSSISAVWDECANAVLDILKCDSSPAPLFFLSAHNQYLAAARLVMSGQCLGAYPTGRAVVEFALYGWRLSVDRGALERWHEKPEERAARRAWGVEFSFSPLLKLLGSCDGDLAKWAKHLHDTAIDFGSHPNVSGLYSNVQRSVDESGSASLRITYLREMDMPSMAATKFVAEVGIFALSLFSIAHPIDAEASSFPRKIGALKLALHALHTPTGDQQKSEGQR